MAIRNRKTLGLFDVLCKEKFAYVRFHFSVMVFSLIISIIKKEIWQSQKVLRWLYEFYWQKKWADIAPIEMLQIQRRKENKGGKSFPRIAKKSAAGLRHLVRGSHINSSILSPLSPFSLVLEAGGRGETIPLHIPLIRGTRRVRIRGPSLHLPIWWEW